MSCRVCGPDLLGFYGNGETVFSSMQRLYWLAAKLEPDVFAIDFRGYGFSEGTPNLDDMRTDVLQVYDHVLSRGSGKQRVFVYGFSMGTIAASHLAVNRPVAGVILQAPFTSAEEQIPNYRRLLPWYVRGFINVQPDKALRDRRPQPVDLIRRMKAPLLVIHGVEDQIVPIELGRKMYVQAGSKDKHWCEVAGSGHNDLSIRDGLAWEAILAFFRQYGRDKRVMGGE